MPISTPGKQKLSSSINSALVKARDSGTLEGAESDQIILSLSQDLTNAIDEYIKSIIVTINAGIPINAQVTVPGIGIYPVIGQTSQQGSS